MEKIKQISSSSEKKNRYIKVGMIGDNAIGKTSLMVKYVNGTYTEDYIVTLGVNFLEKVIPLKKGDITFSIWDLGGQREYTHMLPLVCNGAQSLLFMFDLSRTATLASVKQWYKQARALNKTAKPFLIGTKFDKLMTAKQEQIHEITRQARRFARAMKAPVIFCSARNSINVNKIFKIILCTTFKAPCSVQEITASGQPIIEYKFMDQRGSQKPKPKTAES